MEAPRLEEGEEEGEGGGGGKTLGLQDAVRRALVVCRSKWEGEEEEEGERMLRGGSDGLGMGREFGIRGREEEGRLKQG